MSSEYADLKKSSNLKVQRKSLHLEHSLQFAEFEHTCALDFSCLKIYTSAVRSRITAGSSAVICCSVSQVSHRDIETEKRLRKDLKRTKALLADAQIMLDHLKNNAPSKREIAQLKNQVWTLFHHQLQAVHPVLWVPGLTVCVCVFQLEESEFTCAAAVKARKAMEVEIEDLHVQMDDISKTKQAVSVGRSVKRDSKSSEDET